MTITRSLLTVAAILTAPLAVAQDNLGQRGRALIASHCARCHAIELTGNSPHRQAPPFRTLGQRYPIEALEEALAEGLSTGHPDMPEFVFEPQDVAAILTYLKSIQVPKAGTPTNR